MPEIWAVDVAREAQRLATLVALLDEPENERAARFRNVDDRVRFVVARATRRLLLAAQLGVAPSQLVFGENPHGKPYVRTACGRRQPFNSSHSGRWVLHALAEDDVGVDVERIVPAMATIDDFAWLLSHAERCLVLAHAPRQRAAALAAVWVRKEAYVKALGEGMSRSLSLIGIDCDAGGEPRLTFDRNPSQRRLDWRFADLVVDAEHRACVVYAGNERPVRLRHYGISRRRRTTALARGYLAGLAEAPLK